MIEYPWVSRSTDLREQRNLLVNVALIIYAIHSGLQMGLFRTISKPDSSCMDEDIQM